MNERIRELLADARLFCYNDGTVALLGETYAGQPEIERFAELIVRECAYIPIDMWDKAELNADIAVKIQNRINEHFGVE